MKKSELRQMIREVIKSQLNERSEFIMNYGRQVKNDIEFLKKVGQKIDDIYAGDPKKADEFSSRIDRAIKVYDKPVIQWIHQLLGSTNIHVSTELDHAEYLANEINHRWGTEERMVANAIEDVVGIIKGKGIR